MRACRGSSPAGRRGRLGRPRLHGEGRCRGARARHAPTTTVSPRVVRSHRSAARARCRRAPRHGCASRWSPARTCRSASSTSTTAWPRGRISTPSCISATTSTSTRTTTTAIAPKVMAGPSAACRFPIARSCRSTTIARATAQYREDRRSAGRAPPAPVHRRLGRPRDGEQLVERRRRESQRGRRDVGGAARGGVPGLARVDAGARDAGRPVPHVSPVRVRRSRRPDDARHADRRPRSAGGARRCRGRRAGVAAAARSRAGRMAVGQPPRFGGGGQALADPRPAGDVRAADAGRQAAPATTTRGTATAAHARGSSRPPPAPA